MTLPFWPATASQLNPPPSSHRGSQPFREPDTHPHSFQSTLPAALDRYLIISSFFQNFGVSHLPLSLFATNHILIPLMIPEVWDLR
ncbi:hypothetical protein L873DRAFT_1821111 [Choiromyces venosus 120613-1]|uniref:Uncharacterized protein n=1 Tax=Choiromyces venosus 120613-1 TaxID=1336337 RepID=A0A3N4IW16_9PEZI|nr:hypothetical protein L873DRAFT_1821111 [Choiromyces venosus 120613-1]